MRIVFLAVIIALAPMVPELSFAQYSSKVYDLDSTADAVVIIRSLPNNNLMVFDFGATYNEQYLGSITLSSDGSQLLQKKALKTPAVFYTPGKNGNALTVPNGDFIVPLNLTRRSTPANGSSINAALARYSPSGDTVWTRTYTDTAVSKEASLCVTRAGNGDLIIGGNHRNPDYYAISSAQIIRTDSNGFEKWRKTYQKFGGKHCYINNVQELSDGRILASATTSEVIHTGNNYNYIRVTPWVFITDSAGNLVKEHLFPNRYGGNNNWNYLDASATLFVDKNGGYFMYGRIDSVLKPGDYLAFSNDPSFITRMDTNFNVIWERIFADTNTMIHISSAKQLHDSSSLFMGEWVNDSLGFRGWACRINMNGTITWRNIYNYDTVDDQYFLDAVEHPDRSISFVGAAKDHTLPPWHFYEVWVLTVDSNGCAQPGCAPTAIAPLPAKKETEISLYPNPTTGSFTLHVPTSGDFTLYSVQGQKVAAYVIHSGDQQLRLPDSWPAGIYYGRFTSIKGISQLVKIIYQH